MKKTNKAPFYKSAKFRYGSISTILIAVFLVCLILVNILASFLSERLTALRLDLTVSADFSISERNREYIESIDTPVDIIVASSEDFYTSQSGLAAQLSERGFLDPTGGRYFLQTVELLRNYQRINNNITLRFIDPRTPAFVPYRERYGNTTINEGDIIIDRTFEYEGTELTRYRVLGFSELYLTETRQDGMRIITGSIVESSVTSALFYALSDRTDIIAVITGYGTTDIDHFLHGLSFRGYDFVEVPNLTSYEIPEEATMVLLAAPTIDLSESDVTKLGNFLLGEVGADDHEYGRSLIYFASSMQGNLPNLDNFLAEWGFEFGSGALYETDSNFHIPDMPTSVFMTRSEGHFAQEINEDLQFLTRNLRPMTLRFQSRGNYFVYNVLETSPTCVIRPNDADENWSSAALNTRSYTTVGISRFVTGDPTDEEGATPRFSNVIAVASVNFVGQEYAEIAFLGNDTLLTSLINTAAGREAEILDFGDREINHAIFTPTQTQATVILYITVVAVPLIALVIGTVLIIKRKRK